MSHWPNGRLYHEMQHCVLRFHHFFPAQFFIISDVPGGPEGGQRTDGDGAFKVGEGEGILADRLPGIRAGFPATSGCEIVKFDVLQVVDLVDGIGGWPGFDPVGDITVCVVGIQLRLFPLSFFALLLSLSLSLCPLDVFLLLGQPV